MLLKDLFSKKGMLTITGIAVTAMIGFVFAVRSLLPLNPTDTRPRLLTVQSGASVASVGRDLKTGGVIRSDIAFKTLARLKHSDVKTGLYYVSPSKSPATILAMLSEGKASEVSVTFPEGLRIEEVAQLLVKAKLIGSADEFTKAAIVSTNTPDWLITEYGLVTGDSLEGFLFPDTYRFAAETTPITIVNKLLTNFRTRTNDLNLTYDQVKLASIVEREALFDEDRPSIAGVYVNRLRIGMKLDADPTVQYAKATNELSLRCHPERPRSAGADQGVEGSSASTDPCPAFDYWPTLTIRDYDLTDSHYNTYRNPGLPPTPIANPGLSSLQAAKAPDKHDFLYFLHDRDGHTHFARTIDEHSLNKMKFLQ